MFIIGDVHGDFALLEGLYNVIKTEKETIYSVGDIIDRGSESLKCLEFIRKNEIKPVLGNHEMMLLRTFNGPEKYVYHSMHLNNGGAKTFQDFSKLDIEDQEDILEYLDSLPLIMWLETENIIITHAGMDIFPWVSVEKNISRSLDNPNLLWLREEYLNDSVKIKNNVKIVTGHTPTQYISGKTEIWTDGKNKFVVDVGSYLSKTLAALQISDGKVTAHYFSSKSGYYNCTLI